MAVPCLQGGVEGPGRAGLERDPYPPAHPSFPGPGRQGSAHIRNAGVGAGLWGGGVLVAVVEASAALFGALLPKGACPPPRHLGKRPPRGPLRKPSHPPSSTFPAQAEAQGLSASSPALGRRSRGTLGSFGGATHTPSPRLRPHVRTSQAATWGSFFFFLFFFFKLSLLSLLGATWWCAGGVSLPAGAPPLSLSPAARLAALPGGWRQKGSGRARL